MAAFSLIGVSSTEEQISASLNRRWDYNGSEKRVPYVNIFNEMGGDWEAIVNARQTRKETSFIESVVGSKGIVLDLCCGTGRHSITLTRKGWSMIGLDLSRNLLTIAKQNMQREGAYFPLVRGDMRHFPFRNRVFSAVLCMFTSFGYLPSIKEDMKSLTEVRRSLKTKGKFLLDVVNPDHLAKIFQEKEWAEYPTFYMLERRELDLQASKMLSHWTIIKKGSRETRNLLHELRLYPIQKLQKMLTKAGFRVKRVYGGYEKQELNPNNSRLIALAERID